MAGEQTDPLVALLDKSGLSVAQKSGIWDLYTAAKDTSDLEKRLNALKLPDAVKADLWDLKDAETKTAEKESVSVAPPKLTDLTPYPINEAGQRIDASGKVVEPGFLDKVVAIGKGESPAATLAIDLLPLLNPAALRAMKIGARTVGEAPPLVKGGVTYAALKAAHHATGLLPEPLPTIGSILAAGVEGRGATAASEAATSVAERTPMGFPKPGPTLSPREFTQQRRTEWRTSRGLPAEGYPPKVDPEVVKQEFKATFTAPGSTAKGEGKLKLNVQEAGLALKLIKGGLKGPEVEATILELRKMPIAWQKLPTDSEIAQIIAERNATGSWPQP